MHDFACYLGRYREVRDCTVELNFQRTRFLSPAAIALLDGFRHDARNRDVEIQLNLDGTRETLRRYLARIGFLGLELPPETDYAIPLHQFTKLDDGRIGQFILSRWLSKSPVSSDAAARGYTASAVG